MPAVLCIGGNDPTGGAGLSMDTRVGQYFNVPVYPVISSITVQDGEKVSQVDWVSPQQLTAQLEAVCHAHGRLPEVIKIGLFTDPNLLDTFVDYYHQYHQKLSAQAQSLLIYDPVFTNGRGDGFLQDQKNLDEVIRIIRNKLLPICSIITPNHHELATLNSIESLSDDETIETQAIKILQHMPKPSLFTSTLILSGGHGEETEDIHNTCFSFSGNSLRQHTIKQPRYSGNYRGTGCALATALACQLAQNRAEKGVNNHLTHLTDLTDLIEKSFAFVNRAVSYTYQNIAHQDKVHAKYLHFSPQFH